MAHNLLTKRKDKWMENVSTVDYVNTLGAGAGFNTKEIVSALVEAERAPKESRLNDRILDSETQISDLAKAVSSLDQLSVAAKRLNDKNDFNNFTVSNSQTSALTIAADSNADIGAHSISVTSVAREQRTNLTPNGDTKFTSKTQLLNSGAAFNLTIEIGNSSTVSHTIAVSTTTPQGITDAINAADINVTANLIDKGTSGTDYIIQLVGKSGSEGQFTVTPSVGSMLSSDTPVGFTASDAALNVNGVAYSRSTNSINDVVSGLTFTLNGTTTGTAAISVTRDTSTVEDNIKALVESFNNSKEELNNLKDRDLNGSLAGDTIFRNVVRSVTNLFTHASSTPGTAITRLSDIGISINKSGFLDITETKLSSALAANFDDIRTVFSADTNLQSSVGEANRGISGDLTKLIEDLTGTTGYFTTQTTRLNNDVDDYQDELTELEDKMRRVQERYEKQFASMNALIDELNNTKDNLISSFENLPFTNRRD